MVVLHTSVLGTIAHSNRKSGLIHRLAKATTLFGVSALGYGVALAQPQADPQTHPDAAFEAAFWEAQKYKLTERPDEAIAAFERCDALKPEGSLSKVELAKLYFEKGRNDKALEYSSKAEALPDIDAQELEVLAEIHAELGLTRSAAGLLERASALRPDDLELMYALATVQIDARLNEAALSTLQRIEAKEGLTAEVGLEKKRLYLISGDVEAAAQALNDLDKAFPQGRIYALQQADLYAANGQSTKAIKIWKGLLKEDTANPHASLGMSAYYQQQGQYEESYQLLKTALQSPELDIDAKIAVLLSFYQASEQSPALKTQSYELLEIAEQVHPTEAKVQAMKGDFLLRDNRKGEAQTAYRNAVSLPGGSLWPIWQQLLSIDLELRQWDRLYSEAVAAVQTHPNQPMVWLFMGYGAERTERTSEARKAFETGRDLAFGQTSLLAQFEASLGMVCDALKDFATSDKHFGKALQLEPDNPLFLNNYAWVLAERSTRLNDALRFTQRSNQLDPNNPNSLDTYAWVLHKMGRNDEALVQIDRAVGLAADPVYWEHKGVILEALGRRSEALSSYQKALELTRSRGQEPTTVVVERLKALQP